MKTKNSIIAAGKSLKNHCAFQEDSNFNYITGRMDPCIGDVPADSAITTAFFLKTLAGFTPTTSTLDPIAMIQKHSSQSTRWRSRAFFTV